jgi:type III secretion protein J
MLRLRLPAKVLAGVPGIFVAARRRLPGYAPRPWHGLGAPLMAVMLGTLLCLAGCSNRVELFSSATDAEANDILAVLLQSAIPAEKLVKKNGVAISVAAADVAKALGILRQYGLPRERFEGMGKIFHKDGMISSPLEERARYIYALSQELENTLTKIDGVLVARVHVVLPEQDAARVVKTPASAAVFVKHQAGYNLDVLKPQIRTLVAHSIPELGEDRVSVVLVTMQRPPQAAMAAAAVPSPMQVPPSDPAPQARIPMNWWLAGLAALACLLAGLAIMAWRRRRAAMLENEVLGGKVALDGFGQD